MLSKILKTLIFAGTIINNVFMTDSQSYLTNQDSNVQI